MPKKRDRTTQKLIAQHITAIQALALAGESALEAADALHQAAIDLAFHAGCKAAYDSSGPPRGQAE